MVLNIRKRILAGLMAVLASSIAFAQDRAAGGPVDFSLRSIDGQTITSASLRGEVVVLAFGASWLPLSKAQLQGIGRLADEYSNRGGVVYWVSTESENSRSKNFASDEQLRGFAQKYGLKVTVLRDPHVSVSKNFGIAHLPSIVISDQDGLASAPIRGLDPHDNLATQQAERLDRVLYQTANKNYLGRLPWKAAFSFCIVP